jgi:hypothetical protein
MNTKSTTNLNTSIKNDSRETDEISNRKDSNNSKNTE